MMCQPQSWPVRRAGLLAAAILIAAAAASTAPAASADPDSALARVLDALPGEPLSLDEVIESALREDTAVKTARADLAAAAGAERREGGAFVPELFGEAERSSDRQPTASFFSGADLLEQEQTRLSGGARVILPIGTELTASLNSVRLTSNSTYATLSPQINTFGRLDLVQPLLDGFGVGARGDRDAAGLRREGAEAALAEARLATHADAELTYWALHASERDFAVQTLIRDRAAAFLNDVRLRADAGLAGPTEVAGAQVFLAQQAQVVLDAEDALDALSDRLATLMGRRPEGVRYLAADRPPEAAPPADVDELLDWAQAESPRLIAARRDVAAARLRAAAAHRNALPRLDLFGHLGGRGLAGTGRDVVVGFGGGAPDTIRNDLDTGLGDSLDQVLRRLYPTWSVGVQFTLPLGGDADAGARLERDADVARAEHRLEALGRALEEEVRAGYRALERGRERLDLAARGVDAAREQVRVGRLEYRSGRATAFELVRLSADLADAQRRYSAALVRSASAAAALRRLTAGAYPDRPAAAGNPETRP